MTLPPSNSYDSILVVVDHFTKTTHFIPCTKIITSEGTIPWSCFLVSWSSWIYHFWSWASICIQVLEATLWTFKCESEIVISFSPPNRWANGTGQSSLGMVFMMHNQLSSRQLVRTFGHVVEFDYNNIMHSSTQQTPFFANHGLHPKFDNQGVNKFMNLVAEDRAMWLANVWA